VERLPETGEGTEGKRLDGARNCKLHELISSIGRESVKDTE
jgi:hypothetical protein